jgi:hypothetical protein
MKREVSPAEIARQVQRDGARHGLRPVFRRGVCHVAQRELMLAEGKGANVLVEQWEPFRDVDMDHPLSNIWRSRKMRNQHNLSKSWMAAHKRKEEKDAADLADRRAQRAKELTHVVRQTGIDTFWEAVRDVHGPNRR